MSVPEIDSANPYRSPVSRHRTVPRHPFRPGGIHIFAVSVGWLADLILSHGLGIAAGIVLGMVAYRPGINAEELTAQVMNSTAMCIALLVIGGFGTAMGGYIAVWIARAKPLRNAIAVGIVSLLTSLVANTLMPSSYAPHLSLWYRILEYLPTIPAAWLGGYLRAGRGAVRSDRA